MNFLPLPSAVRLREILDYCPETGGFTWRKTHSNAAMAGTKAGSPNSKGYISIIAHGNALRSTLYIPGLNPGVFRSRHDKSTT